MNCKEHKLPELELTPGQVREALQCVLHTILFIRSPGPVTPREVECEGFKLTYTRIATEKKPARTAIGGGGAAAYSLENDVDRKVDDAIEVFLRNLSQIGPELLSGCLTLSFFERRASRQMFGLVSHEERLVWEQWILRVVVNNTPRPISNDSAAVIERERIQTTAESMLRGAMKSVFEIVGGSIEHVPPVLYDFEISCAKRPDDRENMLTRVTQLPPILNLGG